MSGYSRVILFFILIFTTIGCAGQSQNITKAPPNPKVDLLMLMALDSEHIKDVNRSYAFYKELYEMTKEKVFLKKAIRYSYNAKDIKGMIELTKEGEEVFKEEKEFFMKHRIIALVAQNNLDDALKISKELLKLFPTPLNYDLVAGVYYAKQDYKNALKYYESSYARQKNEHTLIKLVNVLYSYLDQKDTALAYLETYLQESGCSGLVCDKLMLIYQEQGNIDGMLSILNKMYQKYSKDPALKKTTLMIQNITLSLLEQKDIKDAIRYLEKYKIDDSKLINLYYRNGQLQKALKLTKKIYNETRDPQLLGKIAMYRFELAKDKRKVMKNVIANFELALSSGINNASFQNYYGYLLIDYDIDIQKGLSLVKQALKSAPNNIAYLDSLAWGYYKLGKCEDAKDIMARVIQVSGLEDKEIKMHWEKIKKCGNKNRKSK